MTNPHLKMGVDSTPEIFSEKHFRQWIPSNKFSYKSNTIVTNLSSFFRKYTDDFHAKRCIHKDLQM